MVNAVADGETDKGGNHHVKADCARPSKNLEDRFIKQRRHVPYRVYASDSEIRKSFTISAISR